MIALQLQLQFKKWCTNIKFISIIVAIFTTIPLCLYAEPIIGFKGLKLGSSITNIKQYGYLTVSRKKCNISRKRSDICIYQGKKKHTFLGKPVKETMAEFKGAKVSKITVTTFMDIDTTINKLTNIFGEAQTYYREDSIITKYSHIWIFANGNAVRVSKYLTSGTTSYTHKRFNGSQVEYLSNSEVGKVKHLLIPFDMTDY